MKSLEEREQRERERQQIIDKAVDAADRIILGGSDGSREETSFLTAKVAEKFMVRAFNPFGVDMMRKDLADDS